MVQLMRLKVMPKTLKSKSTLKDVETLEELHVVLRKEPNPNKLILRGKYDEAIALSKKLIKQLPWWSTLEHWYLGQISSAYYEKRQYKKAYNIAYQAHELMPGCPLVWWYMASPLYMLGKYKDAIDLLKKVLNKRNLADGPCGEGEEDAAGMRSDARFFISECYYYDKDLKNAIRWARLCRRHFSSFGIRTEPQLDKWIKKLENDRQRIRVG